MSFQRTVTALVGAAMLAGGAAWGSVAYAADLPVKAPPKVAVVPEDDVHGLFDISFKNAYITPRGLLVHDTGLTTQVLAILSLDVYKEKTGFIQGISVYGGVWNDVWSKQQETFPPNQNIGSWNEFDWFTGVNVKFADKWRFSVEYIEFMSPPGFFQIERNVEFTLAYSDAGWHPNFSFNPYVKLFYNFDGDSTVVLGKTGGSFDVEVGIVPTFDFTKQGFPIVFTVPTWITVGPSEYWLDWGNPAAVALCSFVCDESHFGVFSTGLTGRADLTFIPTRLGKWYAKAGFQYYHILNDALLAAQVAVGTADSFADAKKDIFVGFGGVGFTF